MPQYCCNPPFYDASLLRQNANVLAMQIGPCPTRQTCYNTLVNVVGGNSNNVHGEKRGFISHPFMQVFSNTSITQLIQTIVAMCPIAQPVMTPSLSPTTPSTTTVVTTPPVTVSTRELDAYSPFISATGMVGYIFFENQNRPTVLLSARMDTTTVPRRHGALLHSYHWFEQYFVTGCGDGM